MSSLTHDAAGPDAGGDAWPLVGREGQLRLVLDAAGGDSAAGVILVGPPGVGKTRLAQEACTRLAAQGHPVTWVTATRSAAAIPFGALALSTMDSARPETSFAQRLAQAARIGADAASGHAAEVIEAIAGRLRPRAERRPVLAVDDAHLLDGGSAALVHHLAAQRHAFALIVLVSGAATPDALRSLWKERLAARVEVPGLPPAEVDALLHHALGGPLDGVGRHRLSRLSAGNPLVLRELIGAARGANALRQVADMWRLDADPRWEDRIRDTIADHFEVTDPGVRAVLELVACAGPLSQSIVERLTDRDAVIEAERRRLITVEPSGARVLVRISLPALAEVIRARLPILARRAIWRRLADLHAELPRRRSDDVLVAAWWQLQAGLPVPADDLLAAARTAVDALDLSIAEKLVAAARAADGGTAADLAVAEIHHLRGRHSEAVAALPDSADDDPRTAAIRQAAAYWAADGRSERPDDEPEGEAELASRTLSALLDGQVAAAYDRSAALLKSARSTGALVWAATATVATAGLRGDLESAERACAVGLAACRRDGVTYGQARLDAVRCFATLLAGSLRAASDQAEAGYAAALAAELAPLAGVWSALRGVVAKASGRIQFARQALHEAIALLDEPGAPAFVPALLAEVAGAHAMAGDAVQAGVWLAAVQQHDRASTPLFEPWIERNRAWVAAAALDLPQAAAHAMRAAELAEHTQQPAVQAAALFDAARLGAAAAARDRLRGVLAGPAVAAAPGHVGAFAEAAGALAGDDPHALAKAATALSRLGFALPAAELAMATYRLRALAGRHTASLQALAKARELLRDCPGANTPLLDQRRVSTMLTDRELQVARLAADGLAGRVIAGRLGLSLRTVNNHLSRAYAKLGISGRADLTVVLATHEEIS